MPTIKANNNTLKETYEIAINEIPVGSPLAFTTGIHLWEDKAMSGTNVNRFLKALADCKAVYREELNEGGADVTDPELTASATGLLVVTLANNGVPGSRSSGEIIVWAEWTGSL